MFYQRHALDVASMMPFRDSRRWRSSRVGCLRRRHALLTPRRRAPRRAICRAMALLPERLTLIAQIVLRGA